MPQLVVLAFGLVNGAMQLLNRLFAALRQRSFIQLWKFQHRNINIRRAQKPKNKKLVIVVESGTKMKRRVNDLFLRPAAKKKYLNLGYCYGFFTLQLFDKVP